MVIGVLGRYTNIEISSIWIFIFLTTFIISIPNSILSGYMLYAKQDSNKIEVKGIGNKIAS